MRPFAVPVCAIGGALWLLPGVLLAQAAPTPAAASSAAGGAGIAHFAAPPELSYPIEALLHRQVAKLQLRADVNADCTIGKVEVLTYDGPPRKDTRDDFEAAARDGLRKTKLICSGQAPFSLAQQEVVFDPKDVIETKDTVDRAFFNGLNKVIPTYPRAAAVRGMESRVIVDVLVDEHCTLSRPDVLAAYTPDEGLPGFVQVAKPMTRQFVLAVEDALSKWRFTGDCPIKRPFIYEQAVDFKLSGNDMFKQDAELPLSALLAMMADTPALRQKVTTRDGACPTRVSFTPLQPFHDNRVRRILKTDASPSEGMKQWLATLQMQSKYLISFLGDPMLVSIPCVDIDLR